MAGPPLPKKLEVMMLCWLVLGARCPYAACWLLLWYMVAFGFDAASQAVCWFLWLRCLSRPNPLLLFSGKRDEVVVVVRLFLNDDAVGMLFLLMTPAVEPRCVPPNIMFL